MVEPVYIPEVHVDRPGQVQEEKLDLRHDGLRQYFLMHWLPTEDGSESSPIAQPKAAIVFVHGFGEHVGRYRNIFRMFSDRGYQVSGFDQRGYGRTWYENPNPDQTHGWTTWDEQMKDISLMLQLTRARLDESWGKNKVPIFLLGHSMGGGLTAGFFTRPAGSVPSEEVKNLVSGAMLSSPWLDIHFPIPPALGAWLMRGVLAVAPRCRLPLGPPSDKLSRDPLVCEAVRKDPLCDSFVHTRGLYDPLTQGPKVVTHAYKLWPKDLPVIIAHGTGDGVTKWSCSKQLHENLQKIGRKSTFKSFDGYYHEAFHEPGDLKRDFTNAYIDWLDEHLPTAASASNPTPVAMSGGDAPIKSAAVPM
ncbi:acylglycerol lipase [Malassezia psittaci]|uniref:Acylglycerol lipase n=1 Tax=Malassezia psittaci TaxID=1821823 RepID=A0AAF0FBZ0_9BASI|nr:acylglycerol lipase [Malassezia psittaci]